MNPEKRNSIEELFWRIALHYQLLRVLEPEGVVDAGMPVREFPEEAYCFEFDEPGYTLEELLAQLPKLKAPEQTEVAEERATQPVREFPEEAYCFEFEEPGYTLEELLAQITDDNRHEEIDFGTPVGKEVW